MGRKPTAEPASKSGWESAKQGVDAVDRALTIVSSFKDGDTALSLAELAHRTGLYKSTLIRLLASLERFRFLERDAEGQYQLGSELWRVGSLYRRKFDLEALVRPVLKEITAATKETASFYIRANQERVCLYRENSPLAARHHLEEGVRLPLDRGAAGRVLLAFERTRGSDMDRIRAAGFYVSIGERDPELAAAAVPVFNVGGELKGVLAVSALAGRFGAKQQKSAVQLLRDHATKLGQKMPIID